MVFVEKTQALFWASELCYCSFLSFLVDTCEYLEEYVHTEGLFRKSGSLVRLKALKVFSKAPLLFF